MTLDGRTPVEPTEGADDAGADEAGAEDAAASGLDVVPVRIVSGRLPVEATEATGDVESVDLALSVVTEPEAVEEAAADDAAADEGELVVPVKIVAGKLPVDATLGAALDAALCIEESREDTAKDTSGVDGVDVVDEKTVT